MEEEYEIVIQMEDNSSIILNNCLFYNTNLFISSPLLNIESVYFYNAMIFIACRTAIIYNTILNSITSWPLPSVFFDAIINIETGSTGDINIYTVDTSSSLELYIENCSIINGCNTIIFVDGQNFHSNIR